tara:strand:+ start:146 stop:475 length:330 start_codon:yes stop_codon:yes gene_type:complete
VDLPWLKFKLVERLRLEGQKSLTQKTFILMVRLGQKVKFETGGIGYFLCHSSSLGFLLLPPITLNGGDKDTGFLVISELVERALAPRELKACLLAVAALGCMACTLVGL